MEKLSDILRRADQPDRRRAAIVTPSGANSQPGSPGPGPGCPLCGGRGWLQPDVPVGHPDFGQLIPCSCRQQEAESERVSRLQRYSNLGPLVRLTFDSLLPRGRSAVPENQELFARALAAAQAYADQPQGWLVLTGISGCGKTHLAAAIANRCIAQGQAVLFAVVPDLLDHLRSAFSPNRDIPYDELFEQVKNAPLLILDDLGSQSATPWAQEKLFQILNHRYNSRLPTVITTPRLEVVEERWRSRLSDPGLLFQGQVWEVGRRELPLFQGVGSLAMEMLSTMTFDTFDTQGLPLGPGDSGAQESLRYAFRAAREFAEAPEGWLVLLGGNGCGKTHLAAAIANYRLRQGRTITFVSVPDLLDHFRSAYDPESHRSYDELFDSVRRAPLLILDDFGVHTGTPWAQEKLFQILNHRYLARLPTVITSLLSEDDLPTPFGSRMLDPRVSLVIHIQAQDYRAGRATPEPPLSRRRSRSR